MYLSQNFTGQVNTQVHLGENDNQRKDVDLTSFSTGFVESHAKRSSNFAWRNAMEKGRVSVRNLPLSTSKVFIHSLRSGN